MCKSDSSTLPGSDNDRSVFFQPMSLDIKAEEFAETNFDDKDFSTDLRVEERGESDG